jgi:hypothetical protein
MACGCNVTQHKGINVSCFLIHEDLGQKTVSFGDGSPQPDGYSEELLQQILGAFDDGLSLTLQDLFRKNPKLSWPLFMSGVTRLVSEGYLEGKGDGFVVRYGLTKIG